MTFVFGFVFGRKQNYIFGPSFVFGRKCVHWFQSVFNSHIHEWMPCRSIHSAPSCRRQAKVEWAQIILNRSQPGSPRSSSSSSSVFGRTPNAGTESSGVVLTDVGMAQMTIEGQAPLTDSI